MSRIPALLLGIFFACLLAGCKENFSTQLYVFGTLTDVQLKNTSSHQATRVFSDLQQEFQRMHSEWHAWEPGALVSLNATLQAGDTAQTTSDLVYLVRLSQELEERSGGHFNPAIGKLIELWGFHTSEYPVLGPPPARDAIQEIIAAAPSTSDVVINDENLHSRNPMVQFDFGGIAKGYAVDLAIDLLRQAGHQSAIVNAGGDLRVIGENDGQPWRIGVQAPDGSVAGVIEVSGDFAVFTSGNHTRFREDAGERFPHILDPRTGWPVDAIASATVIADDGVTADAAATALVVAGPNEWTEVARNMGIDAAMVIDESGVVFATQGMLEYFSHAEGREVRVIDPH